MAAGQGFKTFATGDVLSAADVNGYLMQGVLVFADSAERDAEITSPQEGQFAYLKDTNVTTYYTGSAWANLDTTGMTNPMTTTGDTIYSSSGSTPARLGIGSTGQVLTVAGGVPTWATPAGSAVKACALYKSASQTISNNTLTAVTFNSEFFDTDSFHSTATNTSRITVPTTGYYQVNGILTWRANANAGDLYSYLKVNGSTNLATPWIESGAASDGATISISTIANLVANDYLELYVLQLTGISKDLWANSAQDCTFSVSYLGA